MTEVLESTIDNWLLEIKREFYRAQEKYEDFNSTHEAYGVIQEELDELWALMKRKPYHGRWEGMRKEGVHLAAMALKFLTSFSYIED